MGEPNSITGSGAIESSLRIMGGTRICYEIQWGREKGRCILKRQGD